MKTPSLHLLRTGLAVFALAATFNGIFPAPLSQAETYVSRPQTRGDDEDTLLPKPQPLDAEATLASPRRFCGALNFYSGEDYFGGSATYIRRYTALTCGHNLFSPDTGFSTDLTFVPAQSGDSTPLGVTTVASMGILSGYQEETSAGNDDAAFARDLARLILVDPSPGGDFADWGVDLDTLTNPEAGLIVVGYPGGIGNGDIMYAIQPAQPYEVEADYPDLYDNFSYYTYGGMSGGPVFAQVAGGSYRVLAETVAGTTDSSTVRAITKEARKLLVNAEYEQGLIAAGKLNGPGQVAAGSSATYGVGVFYGDGTLEKKRYDEFTLTASDPAAATIVKTRNNKFQVTFRSDLPSGSAVELRLGRNTAKKAEPLKALTVSVF